MPIAHPGCEVQRRPYLSLREHPRYEALKKIIEDFPPDRLECLKTYIRESLADCHGVRYTTSHLTQ